VRCRVGRDRHPRAHRSDENAAAIARGARFAERSSMKNVSIAIALAFLLLSSPARADAGTPSRPASIKLRVTVHDGADDQSFRVVLVPRTGCATASYKLPEREIDLKACASDDTHVQIDWYARRGSSESRGSSTLSIEPGVTTTVGNERGTRVDVAVL
jgi:hypothetical protein